MDCPRFDTFSEAFDYGREVNCPVIVWVKNKLYKLYPSGRAEHLATTAEGE